MVFFLLLPFVVSDFSHQLGELKALELFDRQRTKQIDPAMNLQRGILETTQLLFIVSRRQRRIGNPPMGNNPAGQEKSGRTPGRRHTR